MVRVKYRYFLVEIRYADGRRLRRNLTNEQLYKSVRQAVKDSFGDYGIGALKDSLVVKYLNMETSIAIIRAKRDYFHMAHAAFTFIKKVGDHECVLHTLYIGGTIRACQKFLIQHHQHHLPLLLRQCKVQEEREKAEDALLKTCVNMEMDAGCTDKERSLEEMMTGNT